MLGAATISVKETPNILGQSSFNYNNKQLETPFYQIKWNEAGQFTSILTKNNRQVLAENTRGNVFQLFEDKPMWHDAWDIDLFYQEKQNEITALDSVEITENGPLQFTMKQVLHSEKSQITQWIHFITKVLKSDLKLRWTGEIATSCSKSPFLSTCMQVKLAMISNLKRQTANALEYKLGLCPL